MTHAEQVATVSDWLKNSYLPLLVSEGFQGADLDVARFFLWANTDYTTGTPDSSEVIWNYITNIALGHQQGTTPVRQCGVIAGVLKEIYDFWGYTSFFVIPIASYASFPDTPVPQFFSHVALKVFGGVYWGYQDASYGIALRDVAKQVPADVVTLAGSGDYDAIQPWNGWVAPGWEINTIKPPYPSELRDKGLFDIINERRGGEPNDWLIAGKNARRRQVVVVTDPSTPVELEDVVWNASLDANGKPPTYVPGWGA